MSPNARALVSLVEGLAILAAPPVIFCGYDVAYNALFVHGILTVPVRPEWLSLLAVSATPLLLVIAALTVLVRRSTPGPWRTLMAWIAVLMSAILAWINILAIGCEPFAC